MLGSTSPKSRFFPPSVDGLMLPSVAADRLGEESLQHMRRVWRNMIYRCYKPTSYGYWWYGGRGIKVCKRWLESFEDFVRDVGLRPSVGLSIDRINNDGDYEPENVRWATYAQQMQNSRATKAGPTNRLRTQLIIQMRKSGETLQSIAVLCQISRQRVDQIIRRHSGLTR